MNVPSQKPAPTLADYRAAEARLRAVRDEAAVGMKDSRDRGDVAAGSEWTSKLQKQFEEFKAFREGLPQEVLRSIHADRILDSFSVDNDNFVNLTIPADVSDEDAMHALNGRFRDLFPGKRRAAIFEPDMELILGAGNGSGCRSRGPRIIRLIGIVPGASDMSRDQQRDALQRKGLTFPHPIEQALAAAAYKCRYSGQDLFNDSFVRGSVPGFALLDDRRKGLRADGLEDGCDGSDVVASGSPAFVQAPADRPE